MRHDLRADALPLHLHDKQSVAFETVATEVLFGGAAGGGKSYLMRVAAIVWCAAIAGLQVYLFRRVRDDLIKNHVQGPKGFRALLAAWSALGWCRVAGNEIRFWNGSRIYLCHCQDERDIYKYQGAEMHVLMIDELTHFTESMYRFLRNRVRMVGITLPPEYVGKFPRILCGGNPGNIGHLWVKNTFISGVEPLAIRLMPNSEGGMLRQYITARLEDNPSMAADDPGYEARLEGLGSKSLVAAMRWGDWDVVEGAFFDCWSNHKHVIAPFSVPHDWLRFRSGDWGSASPFSIGWWAVVGDDFYLPQCSDQNGGEFERRRLLDPGGSGSAEDTYETATRNQSNHDGSRNARSGVVTLPRGALIRYREDYGASGPNKGLKLTAEQVGARIVERERGDPKLTYGVLDPSAFKEDGGPSIAERINDKLFAAGMIGFHAADNARVARTAGSDRGGAMGGWDQTRARMIGNSGTPMIFCFSTCVDSIRTIPVLQHDPSRAEDLDTDSEDHCADDWRYACMSRPWIKTPQPRSEPQRDGYAEMSEKKWDERLDLNTL